MRKKDSSGDKHDSDDSDGCIDSASNNSYDGGDDDGGDDDGDGSDCDGSDGDGSDGDGSDGDELTKFMRNNGIPESVVGNFASNEVTGECCLQLTGMEMRELAPKIGDRVKLRQLITKHKEVNIHKCNYFQVLTYYHISF